MRIPVDMTTDPRFCGKQREAAGVVVTCYLPPNHDGLHKGDRAEHETFSWNPVLDRDDG